MTDEQFWGLIDQARAGSSASASPERLQKLLSPLSDDEVLLWAAGYVIAGGMGDDSFHCFRSWILGKGPGVFEVAMKDPDELGTFVDNNDVDNELLEYAAVNVLEERAIEEDPRDRSDRRADDQPAGQPFDENTVAATCPKLAALFWIT